MNSPKSVAYGWAGENEKRWKDQRARGLRSPEHQDWKDKLAAAEEEMRAEIQANAAKARAAKEEQQQSTRSV
ncbi:hypothetical protein A1Q1_05632 [Trichosporon asahii var. asahii CBS 2479]|uniref:Uncharacterized protein n=1 Tax=Trichosporon asahii var. asahii (strain ATCC 90039 / CBS 2479 / JCM 2466 / KCTC 7840 / NBRC 103889/ NCYC 2677 / UAMH 7654) TaxID=1186058 RepID=J6ET25_TRIAS|nr:hypothetical protein A1Q1_05632 [Trichosporon asahii var. asahii CBS 2479]EJT45907.1 hypothetical protein A1Q1_05632 [Trichosporon asahii var. asahii CBS 2479]